jgi:lipopolysaccharide export system permease protein
MKGLLSRYLARLFLARLLVILLGLAGLVILLDLLANSDEIIERGPGIAATLGRYSLLRLPGVLSQVIPVSVLLATLTMLVGLARHSELVAIFASGVSHFRLILTLLPTVLLVAVAQFLIEDRALPPANAELRAWGVGDFEDFTAKDAQGMTWFRQNGNFVRVREVADGRGSLSDIAIFRRDEAGRLIEKIEAESASYADRTWILEKVVRSRPDSRETVSSDRLTWPGAIETSVLRLLSVHPRELPWSELTRLVEKAGYGNRPLYLYKVWLHKKVARPFATMMLILLAVAAVQWIHPRRQATGMLTIGIGIGFVYWIFDELVMTIGEAGLLPAVIAAWAPPIILSTLSGAVILRHDGK